MMGRRTVLACGVLVVLAATASASPVEKVIQLMNDMMIKAKREKQSEKERFAAFSQFCKDTTKEKHRAIERGQSDIENAQADAAEAEADVSRLADEVAEHDAAIAQWGTDKKNAMALRKEQHRAFLREHESVSDAEEASIAAKTTLAEGNHEVAQAALVQLSKNPRVPVQAKKVIPSFKQFDSPAMIQEAMAGAPEAAAFEGKNGPIIAVVDDLTTKEHDYKKEIEEAEANRLNAHNLQINSLEGDIKKAEMQISQKASTKAQREQDLGNAKGALADATSALKEDQKYLKDLNAECELKTKDFQKRQIMRQQEIEAIMKAEEIMSNPEVANGGASLAQRSKKAKKSLAQLRSDGEGKRHSLQHVAAHFLAERAKQINSQVLSLLATRVGADPFAKVIDMVKNMIKKLMEEANEEASHKGFCDAEMGTNKMTRDEKTSLVEELESNIQQFTADISELALKMTQTTDAIAKVDEAVGTATQERQEEKQKNQETISDTETAKAATQRAMQVLKEFYDKAANQKEEPEPAGPIKYDNRALTILSKSTGGAFVQQDKAAKRVPGAPEMESGKYTGMGNGGVIGMLEIIESDFAAVIADTTTSEEEAARVFKQFMNDSNQDKAVKNTELDHRRNKRTQRESDLQQAKNDLKTTQKELTAANQYYNKLKPSCVEVQMAFADKKAAREQEIDSLQDAMGILSQDDITA